MSDLLTRYEAFAENFTAKPPTPIEDRWALQDKLQNRPGVQASRSHDVLENGICVTCRTVEASRGHFNPSLHPHDPHDGKFVHTGGGLGSFAEKITRALKDDDALSAAPVRMLVDDQAGKVTLTGVPEADQKRLMRAVLQYKGGAFDDIAHTLRGSGEPGNRRTAEEAIHGIDEAMRHSPLTHDVELYRGIRNGRRFGDAWNGSMVGVEFSDKAYPSTTSDRRVADDFMGDRDPAPAVLHILAPKGTHAIAVSEFGDRHGDEAEVLLDRGLNFRVVGDHTESGRRILDVEVIQ